MRARSLPLALTLLLGAAEAEPWYVQPVGDQTAKPALVKHVRCQASGQPDTVADIFIVQQGRQYRIGRVEYNDGAKAVLGWGQAFRITRRAYDRYVLGGESFSEFGMNALLNLWRALGMRYRLDGAEYRCQVSQGLGQISP